MKHTIKVVTASISLLALSGGALAEKFNYDYVEAGYTHLDYKDKFLVSANGNYKGYTVGGSKEVSDNVYVFSSYTDVSNSTDEADAITVGVGAHYPLSDNTDIVVNVSRANWDVGSDDLHANAGGIGLRHRISDGLEVTAGIEKYNFSKSYSYKGFGIGVAQKIDENISIVLDHSNLKDDSEDVDRDTTSLSVRYYY